MLHDETTQIEQARQDLKDAQDDLTNILNHGPAEILQFVHKVTSHLMEKVDALEASLLSAGMIGATSTNARAETPDVSDEYPAKK
ncbi:hypothetical protein PSACC_01799 [Paramicrosporidium saccamoebae]|uniref:Uncharacterized protein n=1 Tax=Paramicrosporidium saccamoebae TaxID=1246581 RepID=A0A2H9TKX0_9FUNG|nr:hypothetical protein PSACC_01799 [Paramicrosporidium saccamoebae]